MKVFFHLNLAGRRQILRSREMPRDRGLHRVVLLTNFKALNYLPFVCGTIIFNGPVGFSLTPQEIARSHLLNGDSPEFVKTVVVLA